MSRNASRHGLAPWLAVATLSGTSLGAIAQTPAPTPAPAPPSTTQTIEIRGSSDAQRQASVAAKVIVTREEIARFGDSSTARVLARVPGLVVTGNAAQGVEVSIGGMTGGYTAILVNGETMPAGFSIDSIAPETIERIEVIRTPTVDMSTQSIAGTINIVLRRAPTGGDQPLTHATTLRASTASGLGSAGVTQAWTLKRGAHAMALNASLQADRDELKSSVDVRAQDDQGVLTKAYRSESAEQHKKLTVNLAPRWTYRPSDDQSWTAEASLQVQQLDYLDLERFTNAGGAQAPALDADRQTWDWRMTQARGSLGWTRQLSEVTKAEWKLNATAMRRRFDSWLDGEQGGRQVLARTIGSNLQDTSVSTVGKVSRALGDDHTLTVGGEAQWGRRQEDRQHREASTTGFPTINFDEDFQADVTRGALYAQDEWSLSPRASLYLGVRTEWLETSTQGAAGLGVEGFAPLKSRSLVTSPVLQWRWQIPDRPRDQLRLSIGRTYKAPTARDLIPRRWIVVDNGPTAPHFQGNPALRPELAWGLDAAYEHFGANGMLLVGNAYARRISDVVVQTLFQDANSGAWLSSPVNMGQAWSAGVELEAKARLTSWWTQAPKVDLRWGMGLHRSKVEAMAAPGNVLAQQVPYTLSMGFDVPLAAGWQSGLTYTRHGTRVVRLTDRQTMTNARKSGFDLYASYKPNANESWRISLSNVLAAKGGKDTSYQGPEGSELRRLQIEQPLTLRVQYDVKH